jgi:hypothetical protein
VYLIKVLQKKGKFRLKAQRLRENSIFMLRVNEEWTVA